MSLGWSQRSGTERSSARISSRKPRHLTSGSDLGDFSWSGGSGKRRAPRRVGLGLYTRARRLGGCSGSGRRLSGASIPATRDWVPAAERSRIFENGDDCACAPRQPSRGCLHSVVRVYFKAYQAHCALSRLFGGCPAGQWGTMDGPGGSNKVVRYKPITLSRLLVIVE